MAHDKHAAGRKGIAVYLANLVVIGVVAWCDFEGAGSKLPVDVRVCYDRYLPADAISTCCMVHLCP